MPRKFLHRIRVANGLAQEIQMGNLQASDLPDSGVTPGTYTSATVTIDQFGRVVSASSGGYTDEMAQDAVGTILVDTATIDFNYADATPSITADVIDASITNAKRAGMAESTFSGRAAGAGTGVPQDLTQAQALAILALGNAVTARKTVDTTVGHATATFLTFDAEYVDTDGFHSTSLETGRLTVPAGKGGKYVIVSCVRWSPNSVGDRTLVIVQNRATVLAVQTVPTVTGGPNTDQLIFCPPQPLAAGDWVEVYVNQSSGATLSVVAQQNFSPLFGMVRVAP